MTRTFKQDQTYENLNLGDKAPEYEDYENCIFRNSDFSNSDFTGRNFIDCLFRDCNLSLTKLLNTSFKGTSFVNCKLLGLHFDDCNRLLISFGFENCSIELCSFNKLRLNRVCC
jgi:uncharacterized protein YjbI with pentapeptide repeats